MTSRHTRDLRPLPGSIPNTQTIICPSGDKIGMFGIAIKAAGA